MVAIAIRGKHRERNQRQLPVHAEHDGGNSGQNKNIFKDRHHAGSEHFVQGVYVRSNARDQAADRILIVKPDMHVLQVPEDLLAQIKHHHLACPLHEICLQVVEQKAKNDQPYIHRRDFRDPNVWVRAQKEVERRAPRHRHEVTVNLDRDKIWAQNISSGLEENGNQGNADRPFVGSQILEQPLHQAAVIRFT